ncbi:hypothetical protein [Arthrobacter rhizosphaerae]|uniref:hypothetical protein n=1 Tax=Arthrobacter rhizosphaerae TaxID=2855490 RepID=UPI001FF517E2|nr:hypothetical protein [Arthrobacter rhizosphaerae]
MILAHFALFTYIAPFIRDAGVPDYSISLALTVLGVSGQSKIPKRHACRYWRRATRRRVQRPPSSGDAVVPTD